VFRWDLILKNPMRIHPISTARVGVSNNPSIKFRYVNVMIFQESQESADPPDQQDPDVT